METRVLTLEPQKYLTMLLAILNKIVTIVVELFDKLGIVDIS